MEKTCSIIILGAWAALGIIQAIQKRRMFEPWEYWLCYAGAALSILFNLFSTYGV